MGRVFEVRHLEMGRRFAMKVLHPRFAANPRVWERFRQEAQAVGRLESEFIVAATDFGHSEAHGYYLVLEYLEGEDLRSRLERCGPLELPEAIRIFTQACCGLSDAHGAGIVHRDMKPDNLFLATRPGGASSVKLLDFGIAKLSAAVRRTSAGQLMGTLCYMPPEQVQADENLDHRADIYSLGATLYEALTCQVPHPGTTDPEILLHILKCPPVPLESVRPDLPPELCAVVRRALAFAPDQRFDSIMQMKAALVAACPEAVSAAMPQAFATERGAERDAVPAAVHRPGRAVSIPVLRPSSTPPVVSSRTRAQGRGVLARVVGAGGGLLAVLGGGLWLGHSWREGARGAASSSLAEATEAPFAGGRPPPSSAAVDSERTVVVVVQGAPPGAKVFFNGQRQDGPLFRVNRSSQQGALRVEVEGRRPFVLDVVPDADRIIVVGPLSPLEAATKPQPPKGSRSFAVVDGGRPPRTGAPTLRRGANGAVFFDE